MITFKSFLIEQKSLLVEAEQKSYASTHTLLPESLAKEIIQWGEEHIPDNDLYEAPGCGREDEIHVTVLYGLHSDNPSPFKKWARNLHPLKAKLGKISIFENPVFDVIKIDVISQGLHDLNQSIKEKFDHTSTHPTYKPHVTIAYVKKGKGKSYVGKTPFEGKAFPIDHIVFSSRDRVKTRIDLG